MVDATKNKRGRPKKTRYEETETIQTWIDSCKSKRAKQNQLNAETAFWNMNDEHQLFFMDNNGNIKRQGIAEQIGRMLYEEIIEDSEVDDLAEECINLYRNGCTSKEIEQYLRNLRAEHARSSLSPKGKAETADAPFSDLSDVMAERYKWLAKNSNAVEAAIMDARANNRAVTHRDVLRKT